jgi:hypothetical protein
MRFKRGREISYLIQMGRNAVDLHAKRQSLQRPDHEFRELCYLTPAALPKLSLETDTFVCPKVSTL